MDLRELPDASFVRHPWETARCAHFLQVIRSGAPHAQRVLDVGAGDALIARKIALEWPDSEVVCWDLGYTPELVASLRVQDAERLEFVSERPASTFDLILLLDVLEHVEKDREFLQDLVSRNLDVNGRVIMSVPAWPGLYGAHDHALGHYRRYTPSAARALLLASGLRPLVAGGLFHTLLPARWLGGWLAGESVAGSEGTEAEPLIWGGSAWSARIVDRLLRAEAALSRGLARSQVGLPGLSWWAVCEKSR